MKLLLQTDDGSAAEVPMGDVVALALTDVTFDGYESAEEVAFGSLVALVRRYADAIGCTPIEVLLPLEENLEA